MSVKITVITVVYNAAAVLERTIASVLSQTHDNIEYIIIDGGSTDGTVDIIKKYSDRLAYWVSEPDKGIYDAMNKGTLHATGDWINFMNAGDVFVNFQALGTVAASLAENSRCDVVYGEAAVFDGFFWHNMKPFPLNELAHHMILCHQAAFIRTDVQKKFLFDTRYVVSSDFDFFKKVFDCGGRFQYVPVPVCIYDIQGMSSANREIMRKEVAAISHCPMPSARGKRLPRVCGDVFRRHVPFLYKFLKKTQRYCLALRGKRSDAVVAECLRPKLTDCRISVIVPWRENLSELRHCLAGLTHGREFLAEVIIVDRSSGDRLPPVLREYERELPIRHLKFSGDELVRAWNYGAFVARGDILTFLPEDSRIPEDLPAQAVHFFTEHREVDVLWGRTGAFDCRTAAPGGLARVSRIGYGTLFRTFAGAFYIRRDVFVLANGFDPETSGGPSDVAAAKFELAYRLLCLSRNLAYAANVFLSGNDEKIFPSCRQACGCGFGLGRGARKHLMAADFVPLGYLAACMTIALVNIFSRLLSGDFRQAGFQCGVLRGGATGFFRSAR